jgi:hypothetical protein
MKLGYFERYYLCFGFHKTKSSQRILTIASSLQVNGK